MNKLVKIILTGFAFIALTDSFCCFADGGDGEQIDINKTITPGTLINPKPKSVELCPIYCYLYSSIEELSFVFTADLGTVSITIYNIDSGNMVNQQVNTQAGYASVHVSGVSGYYVIQILTETGDAYEGSYTI